MSAPARSNADPVAAAIHRGVGPHGKALAVRPDAAHPDDETLARHVAGELSLHESVGVTAHLLACATGACVALARELAGELEAARRAVFGLPSWEEIEREGAAEEASAAGDAGGAALDPLFSGALRPRSFQCREILWEQFTHMAEDAGRPMDELVVEAMTTYVAARRAAVDVAADAALERGGGEEEGEGARARARETERSSGPMPGSDDTAPEAPPALRERDRDGAARPLPAAGRPAAAPSAPPGPPSVPPRAPPKPAGSPSIPPPGRIAPAGGRAVPPLPPAPAPPGASTPPGPPSRRPPPPLPPAPGSRGSMPPPLPRATAAPPPFAPPAAPPPPGFGAPGRAPAPPPLAATPPAPPMQRPMAPPGLPSGFGPPSSAAVPMPAPSPAFQGPAPGTRKLVAVYEGQTFPVETPRFTIGRSKANSLPIRDGNVSREHAIVELVGGDHYIVDNASTNGVEFREQRITRKAIQDGDVFVIGGHSIEFRFQS